MNGGVASQVGRVIAATLDNAYLILRRVEDFSSLPKFCAERFFSQRVLQTNRFPVCLFVMSTTVFYLVVIP